ncbi:MAG: hypothetical protein HZC36_15420 [Armatimonadetes bacterium]|nr:hypothetical protein [Armatimonadota bacterium]
MRVMRYSVCALSASLAGVALAQSGPTIDVYGSFAPNAYGSPSWGGYVSNAMYALENGLSSVGTPATDPTAYYQVTTAPLSRNMVTSFNSWLGKADPGTAFGPAFASELGNRLHFGLRIISLGTANRFRLEDLTFDMNSSDGGNELDFDGDFIGYTYEARRMGIDYGGDGIKGTLDDIVYASGQAGTNFVNELCYVGVGNAWWPWPGTDQAQIDSEVARVMALGMPNTVSTSYSIVINGSTYSNTGSVVLTPEPASFLVFGLPVLAYLRRKHRS